MTLLLCSQALLMAASVQGRNRLPFQLLGWLAAQRRQPRAMGAAPERAPAILTKLQCAAQARSAHELCPEIVKLLLKRNSGPSARTPATGEARYRVCGPPWRLTTKQPCNKAVTCSASLLLLPAPLLAAPVVALASPTQASSAGGAASGRRGVGLLSAIASNAHTSPVPSCAH